MEMGPLVNKAHLERVRSYIDLGVKEGATLVVDGRELEPPTAEEAFFVGGCLFDNVRPGLKTVTSRWPGAFNLGAEFVMPTAH
jgi:malonate-semialdehyde dehydrogenase (acetylating)/methylmalonate-semialdehyde dehydrogenase